MKKFLISFLFFCFAVLPCYAEAVSVPYNAVLNGTAVTEKLADASVYTAVSFAEKDTLTIETQTPVQTLYLSFAAEPQPYTVQSGTHVLGAGQHGFLHEIIELPQPTTSVTLLLPQGGLTDVTAYATGALPSSVQQWQPAQGACDLLFFPTHSDDDTLYFGPAIVTALAQGKTVQTAYLVHHRDTVDRPHELLNGLWAMGVRRYPVIGEFADIASRALAHAESQYDTNAMLAYQVEQIRRFTPAVILGHDLQGEYGHGVHMLNATLLLQAVAQSADSTFFPESAAVYGSWQPYKTYLHLYPENVLTLEVHTPIAAYSGKTAFDVAKTGFAQHLSQHKWDLAVEDFGTGDCRLFGLAQTSVGADSGVNDLFENVPQPQPPQPSVEENPAEPHEPSPEPPNPLSEHIDQTVSKQPNFVWIFVFAAFVFAAVAILLAKKRN